MINYGCRIRQMKLCGRIDCIICYNRSLLSYPDIDKYWDFERNSIDLKHVFKESGIKFWFKCKSCSHKYETSVTVFSRSHGCVHCSRGISCKLCDDIACDLCFKNSLISVIEPEQWLQELNEDINPRMIHKGSNSRYWIKCITCKHIIHRRIDEFMISSTCSYCREFGASLCDNSNCSHCLNRSFASHPMSQYWDFTNNDGKLPRDFMRCSDAKCAFICNYCNNPYNNTLGGISKGHWCSCRKNKTESKVLSYLLETYPQYKITPQFKLSNCPNRKYDIAIEDILLIIEIDGRQHFEQVSTWTSPIRNAKIDCYKMLKATDSKYSILRIFQEDIWNDTIDWRSMLRDNIISRSKPEIIYTSPTLYSLHQHTMKQMLILNAVIHNKHKNNIKVRALRYYCAALHLTDNDTFSYIVNKEFISIANSISQTYSIVGYSIHVVLEFLRQILLCEVEYIVDDTRVEYIIDGKYSPHLII